MLAAIPMQMCVDAVATLLVDLISALKTRKALGNQR
ncbi:MAG: hypothetical protein ACI9KK_001582, partial [Ascidiaceihabitans sp.]